MNKEIVKKLLTNSQVTQQELFDFIISYSKWKKNIDVTPEQLQGIIHLLQMGVFNLSESVKDAANHLNLQLSSIIDINTGKVLKTEVYEK